MSKMKLSRKSDYVIILLIAVTLLYCIVRIVIEKLTEVVIEEPFEVCYIAENDYVELLENTFNANKTDRDDDVGKICNYYYIEEGERYGISYEVISYVRKELLSEQYCSVFVFDSTDDARDFFVQATLKYEGSQVENAYYCVEDQGYCLVNVSGKESLGGLGGEYKGVYFVNNEVVSMAFLTTRPLGFDVGSKRQLDCICSQMNVVAPWNVEFDEVNYNKRFQ